MPSDLEVKRRSFLNHRTTVAAFRLKPESRLLLVCLSFVAQASTSTYKHALPIMKVFRLYIEFSPWTDLTEEEYGM